MALDVKDKERVVEIRDQVAKLNSEMAELRKRCDPHPNAKEVNLRTIEFLITPSGDAYVTKYKCLDCGSIFKRYEQ